MSMSAELSASLHTIQFLQQELDRVREEVTRLHAEKADLEREIVELRRQVFGRRTTEPWPPPDRGITLTRDPLRE